MVGAIQVNILYSYAYLGKMARLMDLMLQDCDNPEHDVFIDSGAHTNHKEEIKGNASIIPLDRYISDCKTYFDGRAWCYVMLDCPKEPARSAVNLEIMLDAGIRPMPVLIQGEAPERILRLLEIDNQRVCVAGGVTGTKAWCINRMQEAYKASNGKAKIHALGFARWPTMFQLPIASVDSNSWQVASMYGTLAVYTHDKGMKFVRGEAKTFGNPLIASAVSKCNINADDVLDRSKAFGMNGPGTLMSVNSFFDMVEHGERLGMKYFLVVSSTNSRAMMEAVLRTRTGTGTFDYPTSRDLYTEICDGMKGKK